MIDLRNIQLWQMAVLRDDRFTDSAKCVAMRLALHLNLTDGRCDPSMQTLAAGCGSTTRTVERAVAQLETLGFISRLRSGGGRYSNAYSFRFDSTALGVRPSTKSGIPPSGLTGVTDPTPVSTVGAPPSGVTGHPRLYSRPNIEENTEENMEGDSPPNPSFPNRGNRRRSAAADSGHDGFQAWWEQYPRQSGEAGARRAYAQVLQGEKATPAELMAGVLRYSAQREGQEVRYTKLARNWLNEECWKDQADLREKAAGTLPISSGTTVSYLAREKKRMGL